jgi:sugar/nucleoside kinase (ribokinase family)
LKSFEIVGLGEACVDCLILVSDNSQLAGKQEVLDWSIQGGGKVSTAMAAASKLGAKSSIITKIGDDEAGDFVVSDFKKHNVTLGPLVRETGCKTEICFILVDNNTGSPKWVDSSYLNGWVLPEDLEYMRQLASTQRSSQYASAKFTFSDIEYVTQGEILHIDGFFPECLLAVEIAKQNQMITSYDLDIPLSQYVPQPCLDDATSINVERFSHLLKNIDYLISSENAAMELTKQSTNVAMCRKLLSYGANVAAITLGEKGSILMTNENHLIQQAAFHVPIVDTTGAGDVFHGAFCFGLLKNWTIETILKFASVVSAFKCMKLGGRAGIPTFNEVWQWMQHTI